MSEETLVKEATVTYSGLFNLKKLYKYSFNLFKDYNYVVNEKLYSYNVSKKMVNIEWECTRLIDDYTKFKIEYIVSVENYERVKIKKGEIIESSDKGNVLIKIRGFLVTDYLNRWEGNPILRFLRGVYEKYLYKSTLDSLGIKLVNEINTIQNEIKSFFKLVRMM